MPRATVEAKVPHSSVNAEFGPDRPRESFTDDEIYRVQFHDGVRLFKATHGGALDRAGRLRTGAEGRITAWWFPYETLLLDCGGGQRYELPGVEEFVERAVSAGAGFREFLRSRAAVSLEFRNPMSHMLVVSLERDSTGLVGTCSGQRSDPAPEPPATDGSKLLLIGGARQIYLPFLTPRDVRVELHGTL